MNREEISTIIKKNILIERIELDDISIDEIDNSMKLFDDEGLGLDSVEALDVISGIGEEFKIPTSELTQDEVIKYLENVDTLTDFVMENIN